jgi:hypothetical protein
MLNRFSEIIKESQNMKFKLGLDVHGVIDALPESFAFLSNAVISSGGDVHILTGGTWDKKIEDQLKSYGIKWTHSFSVYDELLRRGTKVVGEIQFPDGTIQKKFEDGAWDQVKGEYCKEHNISLHIDDTLIYNDHFTTPFCRLWTHNNKPKSSKKDLRHLD